MIDDEFGISRGWRTVLLLCFLFPFSTKRWDMRLLTTCQDYGYHRKQPWKFARNTANQHHHNGLNFYNDRTQLRRHQETLNEESTLEKIQTVLYLSSFWNCCCTETHTRTNARIPHQVHLGHLLEPAGGCRRKKNSSQGGAHKIIPWSTAQFCPGPVPAPTHRHHLQRAFEGYPDQIFAHSKRIVAGRCVNMAWQCMEGNVRQRHAHWSFQRITRALFVFTLNAAAANLYSLYSLCRLKPAQKSSVGLNFAIPSEPLRMARLSGKDCAKWNAEIAKGETVWNVHRQFLPGLNAWVGKHNIMSFGCRFSIIILGRHAPHQVGIKLGHTGPPMKAFRMRRSGLGPRCKKSTGVARRNYELSDLSTFQRNVYI